MLFFTRLCAFHIALCPHIFPIYNDTRSIVERTPNSPIQRYFCHKRDAHERICLPIFFSQHYCNSCSLWLFHFFALNSIFLLHISSPITFIYHYSVRVKPIQNVVTKAKKAHNDIVLVYLVRSVAGEIVVSKKYCFLIFVWAL